jgi:acyl dehydratase
VNRPLIARTGTVYLGQKLRFKAPVRPGEMLTSSKVRST